MSTEPTPGLTPAEDANRRTLAKRRQRKSQRERMKNAMDKLESENRVLASHLSRSLRIAGMALERCEVADDPSGAADEAASLLRQCTTLDGTYVPAAKENVPL